MALKQLGKYEILDLVGSGATADVYRALDKVLDREVALKVLKPSLVYDNAAFARFLKEARSAANLFHPNIVTILDTAEVNGRYFIAMRYIEGKSLDRILKDEGPLSYAETLRMADQVGSALHYAHQRGFLHQDIKPSNIIRSTQDEYFLTDFGLVRAIMHTGFSSLTGSILGTPTYIPPEIWLNHSHSAAVDQYALACVLYEVITGKVLFDGDTPPAIMTAHVLKGCGSLDDLPAHMRVPMQRALKQTAEERFPDVQSFIEALHQSQITTQAKPHTPPAEPIAVESQPEKEKPVEASIPEVKPTENTQTSAAAPAVVAQKEPPTKQTAAFTTRSPEKTAEPLIAKTSAATAATGEQEHAVQLRNIFQKFTHWLNQPEPQESKSQDQITRDKCLVYWPSIILISLAAWLILWGLYISFSYSGIYIFFNLCIQLMLGIGFGYLMALILHRAFELQRKERLWISLGWLLMWMLIFWEIIWNEGFYNLQTIFTCVGAIIMVLALHKSFQLKWWDILLIPMAWFVGPFIGIFLSIPGESNVQIFIYCFFNGVFQGTFGGFITLLLLHRAKKRIEVYDISQTSSG